MAQAGEQELVEEILGHRWANREIRSLQERSSHWQEVFALGELYERMHNFGFAYRKFRAVFNQEFVHSDITGMIPVFKKLYPLYYSEDVDSAAKFFAIPPDTTPKQVEKLTSQLEEIRAKIIAGDDFGQMAARHSQDPSAKEGGDLGYFGRGELLPLIENVAFSLQAGEVSQVTRSPAGLHLIKVIDKKGAEGEKGVKASRDEIEENLYRREVDVLFLKWMEDLKKKAYIKTYL